MKLKIYLKRTVKILSLVLAVLLVVGISGEYVLKQYDANSIRLEGFYMEEKDSLDVVFIGASETYAAFSSAQAYDEFGFTSYPYASGAIPVTVYKSALKQIRKTQSPKLIVCEINGALYENEKSVNKAGSLHKYFDSVPFSLDKVQDISEAVPQELQSEFYFPFLKYHGMWDDYPSAKKFQWVESKIYMQQRGYSLLKGNNIGSNTFKPKTKMVENLANDNSTAELEPKSEEGLRDLLQYCKDENIDNILFVRFPHYVDKKMYKRFQRGNRAGEIINEYGFEFLNLEKNYEDIGLDFSTDFDNAEHMNIYGQKKFTSYLGNLLCEKYGVEGRQLSDTSKERWEQAVDYSKRFYNYVSKKTEEKEKKQNLETKSLMLELEKMPSES
ncbi:MAG: hypothetical protein PUD24_03015 [Oscillospiraceae bacterium]|nr:hypothetical protein [Oscillospiraceae bacterium]